MILALVFSLTTVASGISLAQGRNGQGNGNRGMGYGQQRSAVGQVMRTEMFEARTAILAEMTDQSADDIKAKLRYKPMWAVLDEYKVDYTAFNKKLIEKRTEIIKQAVSDGKVTQEHADFMLERAEFGMGERGRFGKGQGRRGHRGGGRGINCYMY